MESILQIGAVDRGLGIYLHSAHHAFGWDLNSSVLPVLLQTYQAKASSKSRVTWHRVLAPCPDYIRCVLAIAFCFLTWPELCRTHIT